MATGIHRRYFTTGDMGASLWLEKKQTEESFICVRMELIETGKSLFIRIHLHL